MKTKTQIMIEVTEELKAKNLKGMEFLNALLDGLNKWPQPDLIFTTREQAEFMGLKIEEAPENDDEKNS